MLCKKNSDLLFVFFSSFFFSIGTGSPLRVRHMAAAHRVPQDPIEAILRCAIDLLEIHLLGPLSKLFHERIEDRYRTWVHLIQRYILRNTLKGPRVGGVLKAIEHRRGAAVELIHRW